MVQNGKTKLEESLATIRPWRVQSAGQADEEGHDSGLFAHDMCGFLAVRRVKIWKTEISRTYNDMKGFCFRAPITLIILFYLYTERTLCRGCLGFRRQVLALFAVEKRDAETLIPGGWENFANFTELENSNSGTWESPAKRARVLTQCHKCLPTTNNVLAQWLRVSWAQ